MDLLHEKKKRLEDALRACGRVAVAFSSGVDSTFLLKAAHDELGDGVLAVTARAAAFPQRETEEAAAFCAREGIRQIFVDFRPLDVPGFAENPPDRCYLCKRALFEKIVTAAKDNGADCVAEGSNLDDMGDYRPGMRAIAELGIRSPLREAELTKAEIRALSREAGLPTWDKPSYACLATRFVYGETITEEGLSRVERAEDALRTLGFSQLRVRVHGDLARIELEAHDMPRLADPALAAQINETLRALGFIYVALDLGGYKTGSMNRQLAAVQGKRGEK